MKQQTGRRTAPRRKQKRLLRGILLLVLILLLAIVGLIAYQRFLRPMQLYQAADAAYQTGDYSLAYERFSALGAYSDSPERTAQAKNALLYAQADTLFLQGQYAEAAVIFDSLGDWEDSLQRSSDCAQFLKPAEPETPSAEPVPEEPPVEEEALPVPEETPVPEPLPDTQALRTASVGDIVSFGSFEQDNDSSNGTEPIRWIVLSAAEGKLTLFSESILACSPYNESFRDTTWAASSLRSWLNKSFASSAFSASEANALCAVALETGANNHLLVFRNSTVASAGTCDAVWLLSEEEYDQYASLLSSDSAMTAAALSQSDDTYLNCFWLRSPGRNKTHAAIVSATGSVVSGGVYVSCPSVGVRPVICVDTSLLPD